MARVLILTAGFGEGHNTAARCCREALLEMTPGLEVKVFDPLAVASPRLTAAASWLYLGMINHFPGAWKWIYDLADCSDFGQHGRGWLAPAAACLRAELEAFRPDAVVTTYPVYTGFWEELFPAGTAAPCPFHTVVTDSITINAVWTRGRSTTWCVTDARTATRLADMGVAESAIRVTGFPVSPRFAAMRRELAAPAAGEPFRLLYFPMASRAHTAAILEMLGRLPQQPPWSVTVVLGKQKDALRPQIEAAMACGKLPAGTEIIGWTDKIPELLNSHHVVLGKAGGATVHEARTAARPMLIHCIVPGQEEGNAILLEGEGGGHLLAPLDTLPQRWEAWVADGGAGWRRAHEALLAAAPADPARRVARVVMDSISPVIRQS